MPIFHWNPLFETGNPRIDEQHRALFDLTNQLARAVQSGEERLALSELVAQLRHYAATHFCDEERLMRCARLAPADVERHTCAHQTFIRKVDELAARTDLTDAESAEAFLEFLVNWLVTHILKLDHQLAKALARSARTSNDDVSTEQMLIGALMETEKRFRLLADDAPSLIWVSGPTGAREFVNRAWFQFAGATGQHAAAVDWIGLVHPDDRERYQTLINDLIATNHAGSIELRVKTASGEWGWIHEKISPRSAKGRCVGLIAAATDISHVKASEALLTEANGRLEREVSERTQELRQLALVDPLTGLANRRSLLDCIESEVGRALRYDDQLSLLFIDIDHFKNINDTYGHAVGDTVLVEVANVITKSLRHSDFVGRLGGEEFVAVLSQAGESNACRVAEVIRLNVSRHDFSQLACAVTVSIGVSSLRADDDGASLLARADHAMLRAKRDGRNRCCAADAEPVARLTA